MYVCLCKGITELDVQRAAETGSITPDALVTRLGLADENCCGRCAREIDGIVALALDACAALPVVQRH
jgi:bacterioferritin-associated ferredoxin